LEEIKERLKQQDNELHLLKELIEKGFKTISKSPAKSLIEKSASGQLHVMEEGEMSKNEMAAGENGNTDATVDQGPELPLPVPELL